MTAGAAFRLVEIGGGGGGPITQSRIYDTVDAALTAAQQQLDGLVAHPHRRPHRVEIQDVWTRQTVARIHADVERDPDVCVACGQPNDPFAMDLPAVAGRGMQGPREGAVLPLAPPSPRLPELER